MLERRGNLWTFPADYRIITTNGSINAAGRAVMGRGCALEATERFPLLDYELGRTLQQRGNHVHMFDQYKLLTFPVKEYWHDIADVDLIKQSVEELSTYIHPKFRYVMPRAGCGFGRLQWDAVRPLLEPLPQNVVVITYTDGD